MEQIMNQTIPFNFDSSVVRVVMQSDEPWFVGKDVAEALGYSNTRDALSKHVGEEDKLTVANHDAQKILNDAMTRSVVLINESGMYALVFGSKLPSANTFKRWVTSEVLPSIRKTGSYTKPMSKLEMLAQMANEMVRIDQQAGEALSLVHQANESIDEVKSQIEGLADKLDGYKVADKVPKHLASAVRIRSLSPYYLSDKAIKEIFRANLSSKDFNVETSYGIQTCAHYSISEGLTLLDRINEERTQVSREFWTHPKVPFKFKWQVS